MPDRVATPGQTIGPFFHYALPFRDDSELIANGHRDAIRLHGVVYDGAHQPVPDALIELWQAGPDGDVIHQPGSLSRDGWTFTGWGRAATNSAGQYRFTTLAPGPTTAGRPPFFALTVFARGLLNRLFTRAYLPDGNLGTDTLLTKLTPDRRRRLICAAELHGYRFDIHLQGAHETVFLDYGEAKR